MCKTSIKEEKGSSCCKWKEKNLSICFYCFGFIILLDREKKEEWQKREVNRVGDSLMAEGNMAIKSHLESSKGNKVKIT